MLKKKRKRELYEWKEKQRESEGYADCGEMEKTVEIKKSVPRRLLKGALTFKRQ